MPRPLSLARSELSRRTTPAARSRPRPGAPTKAKSPRRSARRLRAKPSSPGSKLPTQDQNGRRNGGPDEIKLARPPGPRRTSPFRGSGRGREGPESALLPRCRASRRRSLDRTDSRRSGLSVGTDQSAPKADLEADRSARLRAYPDSYRRSCSRRLRVVISIKAFDSPFVRTTTPALEDGANTTAARKPGFSPL